MRGATGNIYCGLHEFPEMAFALHLLREGDLFVDVGANVGTYSVLASKVCGARTLAVEPDPDAMASLRTNITLNSIGDRVTAIEAALGETSGAARLTRGLDTVNRIVKGDDPDSREVDLTTLDELLSGEKATLIKLDVEGYEAEVLAGAVDTLRNPAVLAIETESNEPGVASRLIDAGFELVFYDPFERALSRTPVWRQSNAIYVRDRKACEARLQGARRILILGSEI